MLKILEIGIGGYGKYPLRFRAKYHPNAFYYFMDKEEPVELNEIIKHDDEAFSNFHLLRFDVDVGRLPYRSEEIDEIYASHLLEHLDHPEGFLGECFRVLKIGGRLHIWVPNRLSRNATLDPDHKRVYTYGRLKEMLSRAGFKVEIPEDMGNWANSLPSPIRRVLRRFHYVICDEIHLVGRK